MRLLERDEMGGFQLTEELYDDIPSYAILSHTWGKGEVLFKDMMDLTGKNKTGYHKIQFCGDQALRDGLEFFWVDTCCIDKSSSAELQEAINSMFQWYSGAAKCYAYLSDVSSADDNPRWELAFRKSLWFTRGWTLQELLAPKSVEFFDRDGSRLGDKKSLERQIHEITGIPLGALRGSPLSGFSFRDRMSWMKNRKTRRKEDRVYSLFGIFGVHLPLIYGEKEEKARNRLLREVILHSTSDQTYDQDEIRLLADVHPTNLLGRIAQKPQPHSINRAIDYITSDTPSNHPDKASTDSTSIPNNTHSKPQPSSGHRTYQPTDTDLAASRKAANTNRSNPRPSNSRPTRQLTDLETSSVTDRAIQAYAQSSNARHTFLLGRLITHLHDFAMETRLSTEEWMASINFLTGCGQISSDVRSVRLSSTVNGLGILLFFTINLF